jgi:hypothetical protein
LRLQFLLLLLHFQFRIFPQRPLSSFSSSSSVVNSHTLKTESLNVKNGGGRRRKWADFKKERKTFFLADEGSRSRLVTLLCDFLWGTRQGKTTKHKGGKGKVGRMDDGRRRINYGRWNRFGGRFGIPKIR